MPDTPPACLHCEAAPPIPGHVLCGHCVLHGGTRLLYHSALTESPLWRAHLLRLRRRAEAEEPLFPRKDETPRNVSRGQRPPTKRRRKARA